jgi:hypothetical protein
MLISDAYRKLNAELHKTNPHYGTSSARWASLVGTLSSRLGTRDILDYGCGKSLLKQTLDWPIREYDPAIPGKDAAPEPADLVVCTDVLEHIEPECVEYVLDDLQRLTQKVAFLNIATGQARKILPDGRNAHLIQQPLPFWLPLLCQRFTLVTVENGPSEFNVIAAGKHWKPWR